MIFATDAKLWENRLEGNFVNYIISNIETFEKTSLKMVNNTTHLEGQGTKGMSEQQHDKSLLRSNE